MNRNLTALSLTCIGRSLLSALWLSLCCAVPCALRCSAILLRSYREQGGAWSQGSVVLAMRRRQKRTGVRSRAIVINIATHGQERRAHSVHTQRRSPLCDSTPNLTGLSHSDNLTLSDTCNTLNSQPLRPSVQDMPPLLLLLLLLWQLRRANELSADSSVLFTVGDFAVAAKG